MSSTTTNTLEAPGASLHYEISGSGPVLLMIPGGPTDGGIFVRVVPLLTDDYTVVTYDPRGISRSTRDESEEDVLVEVQADDASRLLAAVTAEPAYVFGNSGGAVTALALLSRHRDQISRLVAHEPPLTELLPDSATHRAAHDDLYETYRSAGPGAAMAKFLAHAGFDGDSPAADAEAEQQPDPALLTAMDRVPGNLDLFFGHMLRPITGYVPDDAALRVASAKLVAAGGTASRGQLAHRTTVALADLLGTSVADFPGGHLGFTSHPEAFARVLRDVLADEG
jgi:clorobiocin biosynthesis protein CloN7